MFWRRRNPEAETDPSHEDVVLEQVSAYLDGELTNAEMAAVESLVERDEETAALLADLRSMRGALGALGELRAPRSFAIPATASGSGQRSTPFALFRRTELFVRGSAAVAALLFVVALVNNPTASVGTVAFDTAAQSGGQTAPGSALGGETLRAQSEAAPAGGGESAGTLMAPAPTEESAEAGAAGATGEATEATPGPEVPSAGFSSERENGATGDDAASGGAGGGLPDDGAGAGAANSADMPPAPAATGPGEEMPTAQLETAPTGTEFLTDSSQGLGGMAPALGVLTGLLTALSALTAWTRRSGDSAT